MQGFQLSLNFLVVPIFFLSGALFLLEHLPSVLAAITSLDPLTYGIDGLRGTLTGKSHFALLTDFSVLGPEAVVLLCIGSYFFSKFEV